MKTTLILRLALILPLVCLEASAGTGMTAAQGDAVIRELKAAHKVIESWSNENIEKTRRLEDFFHTQNSREHNNTVFHSKESWNQISALAVDSSLLLEASYALAKNMESAVTYKKDSIRSRAFERCLKSGNCSFKKLSGMLDTSAMELSENTKRNAISTQKNLIKAIRELKALNLQSKRSSGLNDSIDALARINSTQAGSMMQLSSQIGTLTELNAMALQNSIEKKDIEKKELENFFKSPKKVRSEHLNLRILR